MSARVSRLMRAPLLQRVLVALVGAPVLLVAAWLGGVALLVVVLAAGSLGLWEFYRLARPGQRKRALDLLGLGLALLLMLSFWTMLFVYSMVVVILGLPLFLLLARRMTGPLAAWAVTVAGVLYIGGLLGHALLLPREWLVFALLVTFATDTAAYLVGRSLGRRPLAPRISPRKTWEGAVGGVVGAALAAWGLSVLLSLPLGLWGALAVGASVSVAAQLGDLAESMLKRGAGAEASGNLLPGHGGVLDRLDSLLFTLPTVYYLVVVAAVGRVQ